MKTGLLSICRRCAALSFLAGCFLAGCLSWGGHAHTVDFQGTVLDAASGRPVSGIQVRVKHGPRVVYDGATGEKGQLAFTYEVTCGQQDRHAVGSDPRDSPLAITFVVDAGSYGIVEIPVTFDHGMQSFSLGEIRVLHQESR